MGPLVEAAIAAVVALDLLEDLLVPFVGGDATLDASQGAKLLVPAVSSGPLTPGVDTPRAPPRGRRNAGEETPASIRKGTYAP